jgi:hypothetical protein
MANDKHNTWFKMFVFFIFLRLILMFWFSFFSIDTLSTINKDTKVGVIRSHKLKDRKYNGQKKKDKLRSTNRYTEN